MGAVPLFDRSVVKITSIFVAVMLGIVHPAFCFLTCKNQFIETISFSGLTFATLFGIGILSGLLLWVWLGKELGHRAFGVCDFESPTRRIVFAWSLVIPASLLVATPTLSVLTILYIIGLLELFPATFLSIFAVILGFFIIWILMNNVQFRESIEVYPKPIIMLTMIILFITALVVVLYFIYVSISNWQNNLRILFFILPSLWLLLTKTIPILNLPEAGSIVLFSGVLLSIYIITGAVIFIFYAFRYIEETRKEVTSNQGLIIVMKAGENKDVKWEELKREFSSLRGEVWASLPYLDEDSVEILEEIPEDTKVHIITGVVNSKFKEKIQNLKRKKLRIVKISKKEQDSPVIHDRIVVATNKILIIGTDIKKSSLNKDTLILSLQTDKIKDVEKLVNLLKEYWNKKDYELEEQHNARRETIYQYRDEKE